MKCQQFKYKLALIENGFGADALSPEAAEHVRRCSDCQARMRELRRVKQLVAGLREPATPTGLSAQIMMAAEQRTNSPWIAGSMFGMFVQPSRPRLLAHLCGLVFTVSTFLVILTPFNPNRIAPVRQDSDAVIYLTSSPAGSVPLLRRASAGNVAEADYDFPTLSPTANLDQFTDEVHRTIGVQELMMLAEVDEAGHLTIVQMLAPDENPELRLRLDSALKKKLFIPAKDDDRPSRSRFVLLTYWMNVKG